MPIDSVKKICPAAASQVAGLAIESKLRLPDVVQALERAGDRLRVVRRGDHQPSYRQNRGKKDQQRHADLGHQLDAPSQAAREDVDVDEDADGE